MTIILKEEILSYKIKPYRDYSKGGFYMIKNVTLKKIYIGRSKDYMARLKQHLYKSKNKTFIDVDLKNVDYDFQFFLIDKYDKYNLDFFNRKLHAVIEHGLIKEYKSFQPFGYNISYYEHIRV